MIKNKYKLLLFLFVTFIVISCTPVKKSQNAESQNLVKDKNAFQTLISTENNVEFQVTPLSSSEFDISINTHSVELDFDLAEISALYDDIGNAYKPLKWEGSPPGGHHRSGILKFPQISKNAKAIKLIIIDSTEREFSWNLR